MSDALNKALRASALAKALTQDLNPLAIATKRGWPTTLAILRSISAMTSLRRLDAALIMVSVAASRSAMRS